MPTYKEEILQALADKGALLFNRMRILTLVGAKDFEILKEANKIQGVISDLKMEIDLFQTEKKNEAD